MFGLSFPELLVIFGVVLIFFGPEHLPELARKLGKISAELKKTSDSVRREFYNSLYTPLQSDLDASKRTLTTLKQSITQEYPQDPNCPDYQAKLKAQEEKPAAPAEKENTSGDKNEPA